MKLLNFDYWKMQGMWYLLPTICVYSGEFYTIYYPNKPKKLKTISVVLAFLRFRVKWLLLTRREVQ